MLPNSFVRLMAILLLGYFWALPENALKAQVKADSAFIDSIVQSYDPAGFVYFEPATVKPGTLFPIYQEQFVENKHNELQLVKTWQDSIIYLDHYRYQQFYKGLRVEGAEYTEHSKDDYLVFANGKLADLDLKIETELDEAAALEALLQELPPHTFAWQDSSWEAGIKQELNDSTATYYPEGELLWALVRYDSLGYAIPQSHYELAWRFEVLSIDPLQHFSYDVDVLTGKILKTRALQHQDGLADLFVYGLQTIDTRFVGGLNSRHLLIADNSSRLIQTKEHAVGTTWDNLDIISDKDDFWFRDYREATTAHWVTTQSWDFFEQTYGVAGMDFMGGPIRIRANYTLSPGAFYGQTDGINDYITFGFRNNSYSAVLDIAGHEFTHGIDNHWGQLEYELQSGALDESFADIFGYMVERYVTGDQNDWIIGDDYVLLRSMSEPNNFDQPNTFEGQFWFPTNGCVPVCSSNDPNFNDCCGVHTNSGVQNFWFHLLSVGGSGTNDNGDNYVIQGIGIDNAALIAFYNLVNVMGQFSQYQDAREGSVAAARILFPNNCFIEEQTMAAWAAVGIGASTPCQISGQPANLESTQLVNLFPNPTIATLFLDLEQPANHKLEVIDLSGNIIQTYFSHQKGLFSMDISDLPSGMYILKLTSKDMHSYSKFVKTE